MGAADMAGHLPFNEQTECCVGGPLYDKVKVVRHEADAEEVDRVFRFRGGKQVDLCGVVAISMEVGGTAVSTNKIVKGVGPLPT